MEQGDSLPLPAQASGGKLAGYVIAVSTLLMMLSIREHPTAGARSAADLMAKIGRLSVMDGVVHGTLMAVLIALTFGFAIFSLRRGFGQPTILLGFIAFALGVAATIGAAITDGFLIPGIAAQHVGASATDLKTGVNLLAACSLAVQVLTKVGLVAMLVAIAAWSANLVGTRGTTRWAGFVGIVASVLPAVLLSTGMSLTPPSLGLIGLSVAIWFFTVAVLLVRGDI
jgi:hypothetical protein